MKCRIATVTLAALIGLAASLQAGAEVVYHRGNGGQVRTLDQHQTSIDVESNVLKDLYEGLVMYDPEGAVVPGAAEDWTISEDGKTYTFTLREDGRWSNGDPVTAEDFVFTWQRLMTPETAAKYANLLYPIENAEAVNKGEMPPEALGVKAVDDRTLEITLEDPVPYFLELLTHQTGLPLHKASVEALGNDFVKAGNMVSNGAYSLIENIPNDRITLSKNTHYYAADEVQIDTVHYYPTDDQAAAVRRYMAGELDTNYYFPVDQLDYLRQELGEQVRVAPYLSVYYYSFNTRKPPLDDPNVRRALSMAIDREFLGEEIFSGAQLPAYSLVPPGLEGYTPAQMDFAGLSQLDREDEAMRLLEEAGYGEGGKPLKIEIRYNTNDNHRKVATAVADMWKTLGIEVSLLNTDVRTHYSHLQNKGDFDVARAGWVADYADAQNFLFLGISDNDVGNYASYDNAQFDDLMRRSDAERDPEARRALLEEAEAILMRDMPMAPLMYTASLHLVAPHVKGWVDNVQNEHRTRYLRIER